MASDVVVPAVCIAGCTQDLATPLTGWTMQAVGGTPCLHTHMYAHMHTHIYAQNRDRTVAVYTGDKQAPVMVELHR